MSGAEKKVDHDVTKLVCNIADTALAPKDGSQGNHHHYTGNGGERSEWQPEPSHFIISKARYLSIYRAFFYINKEERMKSFCKVYLCIAALFTGMLFSSLSYAQEATPQPAGQSSPEKIEVPEGLTANLNVILLFPIHLEGN